MTTILVMLELTDTTAGAAAAMATANGWRTETATDGGIWTVSVYVHRNEKSVAARLAARELVVRSLKDAGLAAKVMAVSSAPATVTVDDTWDVLHVKDHAPWFRKLAAQTLGITSEDPKGWRRRVARHILAAGATVHAGSVVKATTRHERLQAVAGGALDNTWMLARDAEAKTSDAPRAAPRRAPAGALVACSLLITLFAGILTWSGPSPVTLTVSGAMTCIAMALADRRLPDMRRRHDTASLVLLIAATFGYLAVGFLHPVVRQPEERSGLLAAIVLIAAIGGLVLLARASNWSRPAQWAIPLAVPVVVPIATYVGRVSLGGYLQKLGVPEGQISPPPLALLHTGLQYLALAMVAVLLLLGVYGYYQSAMGARLVGPLVAVALLAAVPAATAMGRSDGLRAGSASDTPVRWAGVTPERVCLQDLSAEAPRDGGAVDTATPWWLLDRVDDRYTLWRSKEGYRSLRREDVSTLPAQSDSSC